MSKKNLYSLRALGGRKPAGLVVPSRGASLAAALHGYWHFMFAFLFVAISSPASAMAQTLTFGMMFCNAFGGMGTLPGLIQAICYLGGIMLVGLGVVGLKESAEGGPQKPAHKPILQILAGGAAISLPSVASFAIGSIFGAGGGGGDNFYCQPGGAGGAAGGDLSSMIINFVADVKQPIIFGVAATAFVVGVLYVAKGLFKIAKYGQDPRTHSMHIIVAHLAFGALLIALSQTMGSMLQTIFGRPDIVSFSGISWTGGGGTNIGNGNEAIEAAIIFFQLVGLIGFLRGWVMMKNSVEGSSQATVGQGLTHVIGGAVAVNLPLFLYAAEATFGIDIVN
jgi:hypothetical protein